MFDGVEDESEGGVWMGWIRPPLRNEQGRRGQV